MKRIVTIIMLTIIVFAEQGCARNSSEKQSTVQTNYNIPILIDGNSSVALSNSESTNVSSADMGEIYVDINQSTHSFEIRYETTDKEILSEGNILTQGCPKTANVYRIMPFDEDYDTLYNPFENWDHVWFQSRALVMGNTLYNDDKTEQYQLSRSDRNSYIHSVTRVAASDLEQMKTIEAAFPKATFADYVLKSTFPAVNNDIYKVTSFDIALNKTITVETIKERPINYYIVRRSVDGITVGLPFYVDMFYSVYNDEKRIETRILNEDYNVFYDGTDLYEVHTNDKATEKDIELYQEKQPIISFEQAIDNASPTISKILSDAVNNGKDTHIYAAELVYLTIQISDMSNVDYYNDHITRESYEAYMYPFWVVYVHSNYMCFGEDVADCKPVLINAITGEVVDF